MGLSLLNIHADGFGEGGVGVTASRRIDKNQMQMNVLARYSTMMNEGA